MHIVINLAEQDALLRVERKVDQLARMLSAVLRQEARMAAKIDDLTTKLEHLTTVGDGMEALISTLSAEVQALKTGDPEQDAKIDALASRMDAKADEWARALVANTPASGSTGGSPDTGVEAPGPVDNTGGSTAGQ